LLNEKEEKKSSMFYDTLPSGASVKKIVSGSIDWLDIL
jgi:hypothetical protein